jgi:hypothetical protein
VYNRNFPVELATCNTGSTIRAAFKASNATLHAEDHTYSLSFFKRANNGVATVAKCEINAL